MNQHKSIRLLGAFGTLATLAVANPAFADGALAIENLKGERAGLSAGHATTEEARQAALAHCGEGCSVVETFSGGCAAVATHEGEDSTLYGWFLGAGSESEAISEALEACRARGGTDCAVRLSACDGGEPSGANRDAEASPVDSGYVSTVGLHGAELAIGYGALAIDEGDCSRAGVAMGYESPVEADSVALEECGEGCSVVERFSTGCVAFASDGSEGSAACGWASGVGSESEVSAAALEECRSAGGTDCVMRLSDCAATEPTRLMAGEGLEALPDPPGSARPAGETFRDCPNCPEMVVIPAGTFRMGCLSSDDDCMEDEFPVHEVTIRSFALSKHEATWVEWEACMAAGGCNDPWNRDQSLGTRPVWNVSWEDAQSYVAWLSAQTGEQYRLPTESEWEYAARAGTESKYSWGNDIGENRANCGEERGYDMERGFPVAGTGCGDSWLWETSPVGSFPANGFGMHDMHGNVREWVEDCWNESYEGAPSDGSAWLSGECDYRVMRGGCGFTEPRGLRSAMRTGVASFNSVAHEFYGFRVARALTP